MNWNTNNPTAIQPYHDCPHFWQYEGKPVLLLGGSAEDNLFQIDGLEAHLDKLAACGGNYVRCSMSARDEGNAWYFARDPKTGLYDLDKPEGPYWERFEKFIHLTRKRGIIVQIEVFDRFDFAREPWLDNPFNPKNNSNSGQAETGLATVYPGHPGSRENPFFRTPPALEDNAVLRRYQEIFVNRLLSVTLWQPHVLYCISNETNESPEWGKYWADYIRNRAKAASVQVHITEMWDDRDLGSDQHRNTCDHPETYNFIDISQVNHQCGQEHWNQIMAFRKKMAAAGRPRPLNTVKIYGANSGYYGTTRDGQERFWRNILAGLAGMRFHRPLAGIGLSTKAQRHIRSARMLAGLIDLFACTPEAGKLKSCSLNEAFCTGIPGATYAVFFPDGGDVLLEVVEASAGTSVEIRWLDICRNAWHSPVAGKFGTHSRLRLVTPEEEGYWACVVTLRIIR